MPLPARKPLPPARAVGDSPGEHALTFRQWQQAQERGAGRRDFWLYTDGSKLEDGRTGAGWVLYGFKQRLDSGSFAPHANSEVYDAEARALEAGVRAASEHFM